MPYDPVKSMSESELLRGLRKLGEPLVMELLRRGYEVRLDPRRPRLGLAAFTMVPLDDKPRH